jgi:hypothetical protein
MHLIHDEATSLYEFWKILDSNDDGLLNAAEIEAQLGVAEKGPVSECIHRHYAKSGDVTMGVFCEQYGSFYDCCVEDPSANCTHPQDHCEERQNVLWETLVDTNGDGKTNMDEIYNGWAASWAAAGSPPPQSWMYYAFADCVPQMWDQGDGVYDWGMFGPVISVTYEEFCKTLSDKHKAGMCTRGIDCIEVSVYPCAQMFFGYGNEIPPAIEYFD